MSPLRLISDASRPLFLTASADPGDSSCNLNLSGTFLRQTSYGRHVTDISQLLYAMPSYSSIHSRPPQCLNHNQSNSNRGPQ